ncbi:MAG: TSUP family transporter, partial [bacterium]
LFALMSLLHLIPTISTRAQIYAGPTVGVVSGVMGGTTGIFAPLIAAYIHSLQVQKQTFVYWLTASFLLGGITQALSYYRLGLYTETLLIYAVLTCIPALVGMQLGFWVQDRMSMETFRKAVLLLVLASAMNLLVRNLL